MSKVIVTQVVDDSFQGKEGRVLAAKLTYKDDKGSPGELSGYGPKMSEVLAWKPGEEHEIETYTTAGGKAAFRLPREAGGGGGRGGFGGPAAFRNTESGQALEQRHMNARTAAMTAVENMGKEWDGGAFESRADVIFDWLEKAANGK